MKFVFVGLISVFIGHFQDWSMRLYETASELNAAILKGDDSITIDTATIAAIRIPFKILRYYAAKKLGKRSVFFCESEVNRLGEQQPTIKTVLIRLGIEKYYNNENNWLVYDIGTLLPFYYS